MLIWNDNFCGYSDHVCSSPAYQEGEHAGGLQDLAEYGHIPPFPPQFLLLLVTPISHHWCGQNLLLWSRAEFAR